MDNYFIKGFLKDEFLGLVGIHEAFEHFNREHQSLEETIYIIIKACRSIDDWTLEVRLPKLKSPIIYGYSKVDLLRMGLNQQIEILQYYSNIYILYHHLEQMTRDKLDINYKNNIDQYQLEQLGGNDLYEYIRKAEKFIMDKYKRGL